MKARATPEAKAKFALILAILEDAEISASAKTVATALLFKFQNTKTGRCNPSVASIATAVGRQRRAVFPSIEELKNRGWLIVEGSKGGAPGTTNSFRFNRQRVLHTAPVTDVAHNTPTDVADDTRVVERTKGCRTLHTNQEEPLSLSERECEALPAIASAPSGASHEEKFQELVAIWRVRLYGVGPKKPKDAFNAVCDGEDPDEIIASAARWAAAVKPRYLPKLEDWLANGAWRNLPPATDSQWGRGKRSAADVAMDMCRDEFEREGYQ
ncbi:hypothetical protein FIU28_14395 [Tardiphaga sp. vice154]|uniref:hypothetical protein n=1 Tax=Tardiphaga sp. vice154 TaxID=2592814 RepID=UPI00116240D0|nr:hypothetical protein [Tardiphaga sp. vice154]QDM22211.1 hypothetical protein FIU28_14395 [Tardiphaga sp. vice154]